MRVVKEMTKHKWHRSATEILIPGVAEFDFVFFFCTQVDGSRLFKDVKAYHTAVKGGL